MIKVKYKVSQNVGNLMSSAENKKRLNPGCANPQPMKVFQFHITCFSLHKLFMRNYLAELKNVEIAIMSIRSLEALALHLEVVANFKIIVAKFLTNLLKNDGQSL